MNIKQLRAFQEVIVTGSVSKAAKNLFRTQPAISSQIMSLEAEVGMPLFERRDGRLYPAPEAQFILEEATKILDKLESLESNVERIRNLEIGRINVVASLCPSIFFLPQLISQFVKEREHVDVSLFSHNSKQVQRLVSAQRYDVGIADFLSSENKGPSLINHERIDYQCVCAVPVSDALASKSFITAEDLHNKPLVVLAESDTITQQLSGLFEKQSLTMVKRFETQYFFPQLTFVENGLACAIIDPITVETYRNNCAKQASVVFLPFRPDITFSITIVTPSHMPLSTLATTFVAHLRKALLSLK